LAVDTATGQVFIANEQAGEIDVMNEDGSDLHKIVTGLNSPYAITVDAADGRIFWKDIGAKAVSSASMGGTDATVIATGVDGPAGIAYYQPVAVPKPSSLALCGIGLAGAGGLAARRRRSAAM
jgi:hypothetical protein